MQFASVNPLGEADQCPTCPAGRIDYERPLLGDGALAGRLIERHNRDDWRAQVPRDLRLPVVVTRVMAVEYETDAPPVDPQLTLELVERSPRMP